MLIHELYSQLISQKVKLSVIGLGYVGLPIAVAFSPKVRVIGFDVNSRKIECFRAGIDPTGEVETTALRSADIEFTSDETKLGQAKFHIVAVPTPVHTDHTPNLTPLKNASCILGRNLTRGSIVVYESTVYPGVTEEICIPILEEASGLKCGVDFMVGYSPERINPGDAEHKLNNIKKVVSGIDTETADVIAKVYELVIDAGVYKAGSIKTAEAAKVIENAQRDINIAFMNELSIIFNKMNIDTKSVLEAAGTKWNFLKFLPGLVGGHCIGVDPYYLTYRAEQMGYHSQVILAGRRINDGMGKYIAENCVKQMIAASKNVRGARVAILGFTFKENCPDVRNSKVIDIVNELKEYGLETVIVDEKADADEVERLYNVSLSPMDAVQNMDAVIVAVAHRKYLALNMQSMNRFFRDKARVLIDVKGLFSREEYEANGYYYWRL